MLGTRGNEMHCSFLVVKTATSPQSFTGADVTGKKKIVQTCLSWNQSWTLDEKASLVASQKKKNNHFQDRHFCIPFPQWCPSNVTVILSVSLSISYWPFCYGNKILQLGKDGSSGAFITNRSLFIFPWSRTSTHPTLQSPSVQDFTQNFSWCNP